MKKISVILFILITISLILSACGTTHIANEPVTFFNDQVIMQRLRVYGGSSDHVTIVFLKPGQYDFAFYDSITGKNLLPNFSVTVTETPHLETIFQYSIMTQRVSVTLDGITESKTLP